MTLNFQSGMELMINEENLLLDFNNDLYSLLSNSVKWFISINVVLENLWLTLDDLSNVILYGYEIGIDYAVFNYRGEIVISFYNSFLENFI